MNLVIVRWDEDVGLVDMDNAVVLFYCNNDKDRHINVNLAKLPLITIRESDFEFTHDSLPDDPGAYDVGWSDVPALLNHSGFDYRSKLVKPHEPCDEREITIQTTCAIGRDGPGQRFTGTLKDELNGDIMLDTGHVQRLFRKGEYRIIA